MTILDLIAIAFWPAVLSFAYWGWRCGEGTRARALAWGAASVLVVGGYAGAMAFETGSLWILFDFSLGLVLFGGLLLVAIYAYWTDFPWWSRILFGGLGLAFLAMGVGFLASDYLLPRQVVEGTVESLVIRPGDIGSRGYRYPNQPLVEINGQFYKATTRLYSTLRVGEQVRAEIGRGSKFIFRLERKALPRGSEIASSCDHDSLPVSRAGACGCSMLHRFARCCRKLPAPPQPRGCTAVDQGTSQFDCGTSQVPQWGAEAEFFD
jgi:hypothetical protein